jgi:hypothetical protein
MVNPGPVKIYILALPAGKNHAGEIRLKISEGPLAARCLPDLIQSSGMPENG